MLWKVSKGEKRKEKEKEKGIIADMY